ncbi:polysaccharide deacetylase family protein [Desulfobacter hydrogenophilus]|nr:polysaccharide deacetylase family protein [Desulfobacter hydrogenophilus]NDY73887.1 polysaccharide deacetylase family protein [Desulfobacter hydrogenophilus]
MIPLFGLVALQAWDLNRVPVIVFHSISNDGDWIREPSIVVSVKTFSAQIKWLSKFGYKGIFFDDLYNIRKNRNRRAGKKIVIAFDDGYLDNWVGAFHVLEKYNMKATVFVSTDWIDKCEILRLRIPHAKPSELGWKGYLGPGEIKALQESSLVDIQSHGTSHDHIFVSDQVIGFVTPQNTPHTLFCYLNPELKPEWFRHEINLPLGYPLFPLGEALSDRIFYPDPKLITRLVDEAGRPGFFNQSDWDERLDNIVRQFNKTNQKVGITESQDHAKKRWRDELVQSRKILENLTGKPVRHLVWPRDKSNSFVEKMALESGYLSTTRSPGHHNNSGTPAQVERISIVGTGYPALDVARVLLEVWTFKGCYIFWPVLFLLQRITNPLVLRYGKA